MPSNLIRCATLAAALALPLTSASAQAAAEPTVCLGFAFGQWKPALDWKAAGHLSPLDPRVHQHADDGRDWATTQAVESERTLILLPSWWPAGVSVILPDRAPALGDTITGSAFAYVADGRRVAPKAPVRAWRVPCTPRTN